MKKILIVEDDNTLRENTAEFLREEGFEVLTAEDGMIGVQVTIKHLPDLILCDISMPNLNGYDFFKTIQQINSTSTIPLIFLTAKVENEDIRAGMQLGADDYITKPFDYDELLNAINIRLAKHAKILKISDEKFYALIDNPSVGVYIYQNSQFVYYNEALAKILGFSMDEFKFLHFDDIILDNYKKDVNTKINRCLKEIQRFVQIQFEAIHKTKESVFVELYGTVLNYKGVISIIGNLIDVGADNKHSSLVENIAKNTDNLSKREIEIMTLVCNGLSTHDIAATLYLSQRTVDTHRSNLLGKTSCKNTAELVMYAIRNNLISLD